MAGRFAWLTLSFDGTSDGAVRLVSSAGDVIADLAGQRAAAVHHLWELGHPVGVSAAAWADGNRRVLTVGLRVAATTWELSSGSQEPDDSSQGPPPTLSVGPFAYAAWSVSACRWWQVHLAPDQPAGEQWYCDCPWGRYGNGSPCRHVRTIVDALTAPPQVAGTDLPFGSIQP